MKLWLAAGFLVLSACAASIPKEEHDALVAGQKQEYEARLHKAEEERQREGRAREQAAAEAKKNEATLEGRVDQLESALADKQRTLDDVTSQLLELQDAFGKLSSKERSKIEGETEREKAAKANVEKLRARFAESLKEELAASRVHLEPKESGLLVRFKDGALFTRGSSKLQPATRATVERLAQAIKAVEANSMRIEVHTDAVKAQDGWSVTDQQGAALVRALQKLGIDPSRLSYTSFGQYRPMSSNDTEEGRAENRRIELFIDAPLLLPKR